MENKLKNQGEYPRASLLFFCVFLASIFGPTAYLFHGKVQAWLEGALFSFMLLVVVYWRYGELGNTRKAVIRAFAISSSICYFAYLLPDSRYMLLPGMAWIFHMTYFCLVGPGIYVYELMRAHDKRRLD